MRTLFNLLGPLSNPAGAKRQLLGVFADHWIAPLALSLGRLGAERAWVVHGSDGLDELTVTGPSQVAEWRDGKVTLFEITPGMAGLPLHDIEHLRGATLPTMPTPCAAFWPAKKAPIAILCCSTAPPRCSLQIKWLTCAPARPWPPTPSIAGAP